MVGGAAKVDTSTVQRGHDPTDPEDDFEITVEGFEYYKFFIYFLGSVIGGIECIWNPT